MSEEDDDGGWEPAPALRRPIHNHILEAAHCAFVNASLPKSYAGDDVAGDELVFRLICVVSAVFDEISAHPERGPLAPIPDKVRVAWERSREADP